MFRNQNTSGQENWKKAFSHEKNLLSLSFFKKLCFLSESCMSEFDVLSPKRCTSETVIVSSGVWPAELPALFLEESAI